MTETVIPPGTPTYPPPGWALIPGPPGPPGPAGPGIPAESGSAAAPSISFLADVDTGFYNPAPNTLGFSTGGVQQMTLGPTGLVTVGSGDNPTWVSSSTGHLAMLLEGTVAAPVTTFGPTLKVARTIDVAEPGVGGDQSDRAAAIHGQAEGVGNCGIQPIAIFGFARNTSTVATPPSNPDACAIYGVGSIEANGAGYAAGGFFHGRRASTNTAAAAVGIEVHVANSGTTSDHAYFPTGAQQTCGIWLNSIGTAQAAAGIVVGNGGGRQFDVGLAISGQVLGGFTGSVKSSSLRDDSSSVTSLDIRGTHTTGLSLSNATLTNAIVMSNTQGVVGGFAEVTTLRAGPSISLGATAAAPDVFLVRDTANSFGQRNGANAQALRLYNTFTDFGNFERLNIICAAAGTTFTTESVGTGVARSLTIGTLGSANLVFQTTALSRWAISAAGVFYAGIDNAYDIGVSSNRVRNVFTAGALATGVKAGIPVDGDVNTPTDGMLRVDTTNHRLYVRDGAVWRYAALT